MPKLTSTASVLLIPAIKEPAQSENRAVDSIVPGPHKINLQPSTSSCTSCSPDTFSVKRRSYTSAPQTFHCGICRFVKCPMAPQRHAINLANCSHSQPELVVASCFKETLKKKPHRAMESSQSKEEVIMEVVVLQLSQKKPARDAGYSSVFGLLRPETESPIHPETRRVLSWS